MNLARYEELAGVTVSSDKVAFVTATINRTRSILESMLGFTLLQDNVDTNEYTELGKTASDCPCTFDVDSLEAPDNVVFAYRIFNYNKIDKIMPIDPCTAIHAIKLVKNGVTLLTIDSNDYLLHYKNGVIKYIELCEACFGCAINCGCSQLAVDATWVWGDDDDIPDDLLYIWADMVTYYSDDKVGLKSETLGPHRYEFFESEAIETNKDNLTVLKKYAGPRGSLHRIHTI